MPKSEESSGKYDQTTACLVEALREALSIWNRQEYPQSQALVIAMNEWKVKAEAALKAVTEYLP